MIHPIRRADRSRNDLRILAGEEASATAVALAARTADPEYLEYGLAGLDDLRTLEAERLRAMDDPDRGGFVTAIASAAGRAAAGVTFQAAGSRVFGVRMGQILCVSDEGPIAGRRLRLQDLLVATVGEACARGFAHLAWRVREADADAAFAAHVCGFRPVDRVVTYLHRFGPRFGCPGLPRSGIRKGIREAEPGDATSLLALADGAFRGTRFDNDPLLSRRADAFYVDWITAALRGGRGHAVLLAERAGEPCGFLTYDVADPDFARCTGVALGGRGLGAVRPEGRGRFPALIAAAMERELADYPEGYAVEVDTQAERHEAQRVYRHLGFAPVRRMITFHATLGFPEGTA